MIKKKGLLSSAFLFLVLLVTYIPIISLVVFSFNKGDGRFSSLVHWNGFSFEWYYKLFTDLDILTSVGVTFLVGAIATVVSTIIGTLAAYSLTKTRRKFRTMILNVTNIPIVAPEIIIAMALLIMFSSMSLTNGLVKLILAHISFCTPYVLITVYPKAADLDDSLVAAANDLGATSSQALRKVVLPQLKPAIMAGAAIAFSMSFDDFIISYFVGGSYQNISAYIYSMPGKINPTINALSTIILFVVIIKITFDYFRSNKNRKFEEE